MLRLFSKCTKHGLLSNVLYRHYLDLAFEIFSGCCYQKWCLVEGQFRLIDAAPKLLCSPENLLPVPSKQSMI